MELKQKLKLLPQCPGVYWMSDALGNIIYVGKAKNLKQRVSSYFTRQKDRPPKVEEMIKQIHAFDYRVLDTELEAFIEECRLIKEIQPHYNRLMKNDKRYCYLKIPAEPFPKLAKAAMPSDDGARYFGPFTNPNRVDVAIEFFNEFFPLRKCPTPHFVQRVNGCLYKQLNSCLGPCSGQVSAEEYQGHLEKIVQIILGNRPEVLDQIQKRLDQAVDNLDFERAARLKEYERGVKYLIRWQQFALSPHRNRNLLAVEFLGENRVKCFFIKGELLYREHLDLSEGREFLHGFLKESIIATFTPHKRKKSELTPHTLDEAHIIHSYLKNKRQVLCFWIPANRLAGDGQRLDETVARIVERLMEQAAKYSSG